MARKKSEKYFVAKKIIIKLLDENSRLSNRELRARVGVELAEQLPAKSNINKGILEIPKISNYLYNQIINELLKLKLIVKTQELGKDMREVILQKVV